MTESHFPVGRLFLSMTPVPFFLLHFFCMGLPLAVKEGEKKAKRIFFIHKENTTFSPASSRGDIAGPLFVPTQRTLPRETERERGRGTHYLPSSEHQQCDRVGQLGVGGVAVMLKHVDA